MALAGGVPYAACSGELGDGFMVPLIPYAGRTWLMPCPRSLDYSPPGDWTLTFEGDRLQVAFQLRRSPTQVEERAMTLSRVTP